MVYATCRFIEKQESKQKLVLSCTINLQITPAVDGGLASLLVCRSGRIIRTALGFELGGVVWVHLVAPGSQAGIGS